MLNFRRFVGLPSTWNPPGENQPLDSDEVGRFVDQNADRNPRSPIEPLIRAVLTVQPEFAFDGLDIVSDRRPLSHLLNFARNPKECSSFKFGVQLVGKTLILVRIEDKTRVYSTHLQYRNAFEQTYTAVEPVAKRTTSHHRILNYKFGSINLLVRFVPAQAPIGCHWRAD